MTFERCDAVPIRADHMVGVAIRVTHVALQMMHVGLTYRDSDDALRFIHLADHLELKNEEVPAGPYLWAECAFLAQQGYETHAEHIASLLEAIAEHRDIPYGLDATDVRFDESGRYVSADAAKGLTCATFIAAVFQSAGLPVVTLETWQARSDDELWRRLIIRIIQDNHPERVPEIAGSPGDYRLRPDEIAIASSGMRRPLTFEEATVAALPLRSQLFQPSSQKQPISAGNQPTQGT